MEDVAYVTVVAFTVEGKLGASVIITFESFTSEVAFVNVNDDEIEEVTSILDNDEVEERKTIKGSCIT